MAYMAFAKNDTGSDDVCDFRSDTVTKPTPEMREAMMNAPVGDDVYQDDPSVNELCDYMAELTGKEAALFVCSGVMGNQLCIRSAMDVSPYPYSEVLCDARAHIYDCELGGLGVLARAQVRPIVLGEGENHFTAEHVRKNLHLSPDHHHSTSYIVSVENTIWGHVVPNDDVIAIAEVARENGLWMHCDGARAWNAAVAQGCDMKTLLAPFDSASLCMSKGMGAPIGSVIVGTKEFIERARWHRKAYGGGWRQAGILAAACQYAAENNHERMADDHANAQYLSEEMGKMGFTFTQPVDTNLVFFDSTGFGHCGGTIAAAAKEKDIIISANEGEYSGRLATHIQVTREKIDRFLGVLRELKGDA